MLVFDVNVSHGSVASRLRCGGIFHNGFIANLPLSLSVKEFWKSVNIWRSYRQKYSGMFFWLTVYIRNLLLIIVCSKMCNHWYVYHWCMHVCCVYFNNRNWIELNYGISEPIRKKCCSKTWAQAGRFPGNFGRPRSNVAKNGRQTNFMSGTQCFRIVTSQRPICLKFE